MELLQQLQQQLLWLLSVVVPLPEDEYTATVESVKSTLEAASVVASLTVSALATASNIQCEIEIAILVMGVADLVGASQKDVKQPSAQLECRSAHRVEMEEQIYVVQGIAQALFFQQNIIEERRHCLEIIKAEPSHLRMSKSFSFRAIPLPSAI
ncbi:selenide [Striga asiatica]|uniref:Selenide n=1 Tax=Striga asiatica TaxID=4170 RepID=A0A5A7PAG0_STRAF|nr:selenide [Striga asiatica]